QLTSTTEEQMQKEQNILTSIEDSVVHYDKNTKDAGLDGVVCSPLESKILKETLGKEFLKVTPGIRLEKDKKHDQQRVTTTEESKDHDSTHINVGRKITQHT